MKDQNDKQTEDLLGEKRKRGPKPSGKALTNAQRQRLHRQRVKERLNRLEELESKIGGLSDA